MSHKPVAPPPPILPPVAHKINIGTPLPICSTTNNQIDECLWALDPELQKACYLARVCQVNAPRRCEYHSIASILQEGPTCGLTAVSMLLNGTPTPLQLLAHAREKNYTNNGEMFSAFNLFQLIRDHLQQPSNNCNTSEHPLQLHKGQLHCAKVIEALQMGAFLFVPYDPDFNHSPCLKMGHKAHWALIIGYLINDENELYVVARHGKAKNLAVWSLKMLSESNANLLEFAQPKGYPDCDFLLPAGGIGGDLGLRERAIIVQGVLRQNAIESN